MMKKYITICVFLSVLCIYSCTTSVNTQSQNLTQYVDPYIGTGDHGHVFLGANVPRGFVQLGPTQFSQGWDWCSGYHYSDSTIIGFSHQHLSGTGIGDLGDVSLMPVVGDVKTTRGTLADQSSGIYSLFSHDNEKVSPGYYSVHLDRFGIDVELTATKRVGFHRYTFPKSEDARIIIDLEHGIGWDSPTEGYLVQENDTVISGYRQSAGWAKDQIVYFTAIFSKPMKNVIVSDSIVKKDGNSITAQRSYCQAVFDTNDKDVISVKVALSPVSIENAKINMKEELPSWSFEQVKNDADVAWNNELSRIVADFDNEVSKRIFYTALYHTMFFPATYCDVTGDYRGSDNKIYNDTSFTNLTVFSLWDTYRAVYPLTTIIDRDASQDIASTMINIYKQQGKLPVWHLVSNETDCMVGNPGICVMADLVLKGFDVDNETAYQAMKTSAMLDDRGMNWLREYGYIPYDKEVTYETVAKGLEFCIADWSLAQVAQKMGKQDDYNYFTDRSKSYTHYFDKSSKFMRGVSSKGEFREPFNPIKSVHMKDDYTEGNAWQYTWLVPHDIRGLISLFGDEAKFTNKLDSLFTVEGDIGEHSNDITGLIGQYAHGNEPSHHITYIYPYVGQQWKTAERVREILDKFYFDKPAGICGNEDVGQISAWYILSALGFYQVEPAGGKYIFGSPIINKATLPVSDGKQFAITAHNNSKDNKYIQSVKLNGKPYTKSYIDYADIMVGGNLEFFMGNTPSQFGVNKNDQP